MSYAYPYNLVVRTITTEQLPNGNFVNTAKDEVISSCRHSIKTNREFNSEEMKVILSKYVIYCPLNCLDALKGLKIGQKVIVLDSNGDELANGVVLGKNQGYFNFRIWL